MPRNKRKLLNTEIVSFKRQSNDKSIIETSTPILSIKNTNEKQDTSKKESTKEEATNTVDDKGSGTSTRFQLPTRHFFQTKITMMKLFKTTLLN